MNSKEFIDATNIVNQLSQMPNNSELLYLYKYYKQATVGDINIKKPSILNLNKHARWKIWESVKGTSKYDSEVKYIKFVNELIKKYNIN